MPATLAHQTPLSPQTQRIGRSCRSWPRLRLLLINLINAYKINAIWQSRCVSVTSLWPEKLRSQAWPALTGIAFTPIIRIMGVMPNP